MAHAEFCSKPIEARDRHPINGKLQNVASAQIAPNGVEKGALSRAWFPDNQKGPLLRRSERGSEALSRHSNILAVDMNNLECGQILLVGFAECAKCLHVGPIVRRSEQPDRFLLQISAQRLGVCARAFRHVLFANGTEDIESRRRVVRLQQCTSQDFNGDISVGAVGIKLHDRGEIEKPDNVLSRCLATGEPLGQVLGHRSGCARSDGNQK